MGYLNSPKDAPKNPGLIEGEGDADDDEDEEIDDDKIGSIVFNPGEDPGVMIHMEEMYDLQADRVVGEGYVVFEIRER